MTTREGAELASLVTVRVTPVEVSDVSPIAVGDAGFLCVHTLVGTHTVKDKVCKSHYQLHTYVRVYMNVYEVV